MIGFERIARFDDCIQQHEFESARDREVSVRPVMYATMDEKTLLSDCVRLNFCCKPGGIHACSSSSEDDSLFFEMTVSPQRSVLHLVIRK